MSSDPTTLGVFITTLDLGPVDERNPQEMREKEVKLYKSLCYISDSLEFLDRDEDGIKVKVLTQYLSGEFPYEVGYTLISSYDDRKFLITKVDKGNSLIWFGLWED